METLTSNSGYSTYLVGTAGDIENSNRVILYYEDIDDLIKISISNINSFYTNLINKGNYQESIKNDDGLFYYDYVTSDLKKFNVIIYLSSINNLPIGYTKFLSVQGDSVNVSIDIKFESTIENYLLINIINSLTPLTNSSRDYSGDRLNDFVSTSELRQFMNYNEFTRYSNNILDVPANGEIYNSSGILNVSGKSIPNLNNINLSIQKELYNNYSFGYYNNDIVVLLWEGDIYSICSLTKVDKFNNAIHYAIDEVTGSSYKTLPKFDSNLTQAIKYISGNYIFVEIMVSLNQSKIKTYNYIENYWLEGDYIGNQWSSNEIIKIPSILNYSNLVNSLPNRFLNLYIDFNNYFKNSIITLYKLIGNWVIIYKQSTSGTLDTVVCNEFGVSVLTGKVEIYPINGRSFYINENDEYRIYTPIGESNMPRLITQEGTLIFEGFFHNFRKQGLKDIINLPKIIGSIQGFIYYNDDNKLKYL